MESGCQMPPGAGAKGEIDNTPCPLARPAPAAAGFLPFLGLYPRPCPRHGSVGRHTNWAPLERTWAKRGAQAASSWLARRSRYSVNQCTEVSDDHGWPWILSKNSRNRVPPTARRGLPVRLPGPDQKPFPWLLSAPEAPGSTPAAHSRRAQDSRMMRRDQRYPGSAAGTALLLRHCANHPSLIASLP